MNQCLFTIGHSTHPTEVFIGLLERHRIGAVADVRSRPYSRFNPQYNRESLQAALKAHGIAYVFLGKELGARSENPACYVNGKVCYDRLAEDALFIAGLERVRRGLAEYRLALMCAEKDAAICHRGILICRRLRAFGLELKHILADGGLESQSDLEKRLTRRLGIEPDMLRQEAECVEEAYRRQGKKIAYAG